MSNRSPLPAKIRIGNLAPLLRRLRPDRCNDESGSSLVEFAFVLPLFLLIVTGMTTFGIALNQYLELDNAVAIGAQQLAISRSAVDDPCAEAVSSVSNAAPFLDAGSISYTIVFTPPSGSNNISPATFTSSGTTPPSCPGADTTNMGLNGMVQLQATYPCTITIYGGNLVPGCKLQAQVSEVIQ